MDKPPATVTIAGKTYVPEPPDRTRAFYEHLVHLGDHEIAAEHWVAAVHWYELGVRFVPRRSYVEELLTSFDSHVRFAYERLELCEGRLSVRELALQLQIACSLLVS